MRTTRAKLTQLLGLFAVLTLIVAGFAAAPVAEEEHRGRRPLRRRVHRRLQGVHRAVDPWPDHAASPRECGGDGKRPDSAGTVAARKALESGEIDMYWGVHGDNWITHPGRHEAHPGSSEANFSRGQGGAQGERHRVAISARSGQQHLHHGRAQRGLRQARRQEAF